MFVENIIYIPTYAYAIIADKPIIIHRYVFKNSLLTYCELLEACF